MEGLKWFIQGLGDVSSNTLRFIPYLGPQEYLAKNRIDNKVAIVTGGNAGIGKETARQLAAKGAKVIIGCRDVKRGQQAADEINNDKQVKNNGKVYFKQLDLASFESIRNFADEINREEDVIDILVNNAGLHATKLEHTKDGNEIQFQVNHLGHFLLTLLLLDKLKQSKSIARIINVASNLYFIGTTSFDQINSNSNYDGHKVYGTTKLANILFTRELAKRLHGTNIRVYAVHPGMVKTDIANGTISRVALAFKSLLSISAHHGCQTIIYCAVDNEVVNESGHFYANFTKYVNQRCAVRNYIAEFACDDQSAQMLWNLSCELVKLEDKFNIPPPDDTVIVN